jgi:capsular polysaccharide biosynthesis protein
MNTIAETYYNEDELSLRDAVDFLARYWISILGTAGLGLALSLAYIVLAPPVYESKLQIEMARTNGSNTGQNADVRGMPIEEASLLVERLRLPSTYTDPVAHACATTAESKAFDQLVRRVKARPVKGVNAVVEVTTLGRSPEQARVCAESVFEMVRAQQNQLLLPLLTEIREDIRSMQSRLDTNQEFLASLEKTSIQSAVYLAKRDESLWLMEQISSLERSLRQTTETRLVSPIYAANKPVAPHAVVTGFAGLLAGLLLGLLWALIRHHLAKKPAMG